MGTASNKKKRTKPKKPTSRMFEVMQYEFNPKTGESLNFTERNIINALKRKVIKKWAYICHDKDPFLPDDFAEEDFEANRHLVGTARPRHWHCVIYIPDKAFELHDIATWFGVPVNQVNLLKGRNAFLDMCEYLTHERAEQQELGKYRYSDDEVKSNFDYRKEIEEYREKKAKYGSNLSIEDELIYWVTYEGMTLKECREKYKLEYMKMFSQLQKCRLDYLRFCDPPKVRLNFYISGTGGVGKGLTSKSLARLMYPDKDDDEIFFTIGSKNSTFDGYDGQPVIIWDDCRSSNLFAIFKDRGTIFNVFDPHPSRGRQDVKYSSITLLNEVNIVNSVQDPYDFLDSLSGCYKIDNQEHRAEAKSQAYRRFPFLLCLTPTNYDFHVNEGVRYGNSDFLDYNVYSKIKGNVVTLKNLVKGDSFTEKEILKRLFRVVIDEYTEVKNRLLFKDDSFDKDVVEKMLADFGDFEDNPFTQKKEADKL